MISVVSLEEFSEFLLRLDKNLEFPEKSLMPSVFSISLVLFFNFGLRQLFGELSAEKDGLCFLLSCEFSGVF